jgi:hypothetical protein
MILLTTELTKIQLNWAVAKCEDMQGKGLDWVTPAWTTYWRHSGPIIEREGITITHYGNDWEDAWSARKGDGHWKGKETYGPTPLIAAMRCYVQSKMGDEVEIPEELQ